MRLAAELLGQILTGEKIIEPDPGSALTVDRVEKRFTPFVISFRSKPSAEERSDSVASLRGALDADARAKAQERAIVTAMARIEEARRSGASLYLTNIDAPDMMSVVRYAPDILDRGLRDRRR